MDSSIQQRLIEAARLAPSADNSQPWQYDWENDALNLWIDAQRSGGVSDARYVLSDLAIGACIENIAILAKSLGFSTQTDYLPDEPNSPLWAAKLSFSPSDPGDEVLTQAIEQRHTNRSFPWSGPISQITKQAICSATEQFPNTKLTWLDGTALYKTALKAMWKAESLRFKSQHLHQELFSSIRFDIGYKATCEEGLAPATLAIEPPLKSAFKALKHWRLMRILNFLGMNYLIGFRSAVLPCLLSPGLCLLSLSKTDRPAIIKAGRSLERAWLTANTQGLAVQPFAAAGVLSLGLSQLEQRHAHTPQKIASTMQKLDNNHHGLIFLRMGKTKQAVQQSSGRRKASSLHHSTPSTE